jgi:hypothetical protein
MFNAPTYPVARWRTPVSRIPAQSSGNLHIVKRVIPEGTILPLDDESYTGAIFAEDTEVTILREGNPNGHDQASIWMSDTPMEYYSMWELVGRIPMKRGTKVMVGGLGLGLLIHMLALRRDITHITVVEISEDVIKMVKPYLPSQKGLTIEVVKDDFFHYCYKNTQAPFDVVIVDTWKDNNDRANYDDAKMCLEDNFMDSLHLYWAFQHHHETELATSVYLYDRIEKSRKVNTVEKE